MASTFTRMGLRGGLTVLVAGSALAWPSTGLADGPPDVTRAPDIEGRPVVGETLRAVRGQWTGSEDTTTGYTWLRCPDEDFDDCITIPRATEDSYELTDADADQKMRVTLWATASDESSYKVSDATDVVKAPAGATPVPGGSPAAPNFDITAPVKSGAVLPASAKRIKPKPVVRISGRTTVAGTRITRFTVKAPKGATTKLACSKGTCPVHKQTIKGGHTSHLAKFERTLKAGTRIQLTISRKGYVSEITIITIRSKRAPARSDSCLLPGRTKRQKC